MRNTVFLVQDFAEVIEHPRLQTVNVSDAFKNVIEQGYSSVSEAVRNLEQDGFQVVPCSNSHGYLEETDVYKVSYGIPQ